MNSSRQKKTLLLFVLTLVAMLIAASCSGVEPAPEPTKDIFSSSTGMSPAQMEKARAESAAEQDAEATKIAEDRSKQRADSDAKDDARRAAAAESDAQTTADRAAWLKDVKASEAEAAAEREAEFNKFMAAAAQAQADQEKADQEKADQEKAEKEKADKDKSDTDGKSSDEAAGPTDAEYEAALLFVHDVFDARYPTGKAILNADRGAAALKKYGVDVTSGESIIDGLTLTIHEDGHALNGSLKREDGRENYYLIAQLEDGTILDFAPLGLTTPNKSDYFQGISRSAILLDSQNYKRPPADCKNCILSPHDGDGEWGSDGSYSSLYLTDAPKSGVITHYKEGFPGFDPDFIVPTNDSFDSGDQGYGMLLEETVQYSGSLAWKYYVDDIEKTRGSGKHGMLQWLWWNERYLKLVREEYPAEHEFFIEHWAEVFLTVWGRAWRYLDTPSMLYNADEYDDLLELVTDDLMLGEVQYVRELYHGGAYKRGSELAASTLNTDPDDITWEGPTLSGVPLIVDSEAVDGIYFATMPEGFTAVDENRQGLADLSEYIDKYNAGLSVGNGGYGNTADDTESEAKILD